MRRVFLVDVLGRDSCGGRLRILAAMDSPAAIRAILESLGLPSRAPPIAAAVLDPETGIEPDLDFDRDHEDGSAFLTGPLEEFGAVVCSPDRLGDILRVARVSGEAGRGPAELTYLQIPDVGRRGVLGGRGGRGAGSASPHGAHDVLGVGVKAAATVTAADFRGLRMLEEAAGKRPGTLMESKHETPTPGPRPAGPR